MSNRSSHRITPVTLICGRIDTPIGVPILILKQRQVLISIRPKDFSFVLDESLPEIFSVFNQYRQKINLIQSSAVNLSLCVDDSRYLERVVDTLQTGFRVVYNKGMELLTVRGYDELRLTAGSPVPKEFTWCRRPGGRCVSCGWPVCPVSAPLSQNDIFFGCRSIACRISRATC